jgi:HRD ubiquitin ligase complex, ER membrane component
VRGVGFQFASGLNDVPAEQWFGLYLTAHTPRDYDWPRKCHDLLEYYHGGGPSAPTDPPHHVPCIADEPLQPERVGGGSALAYQHGDLDKTGQDYRAYFAGCVVMGGGGTFHWEGGKFGLPPTEAERHCAQESLVGLSVFPPGISNNGYRRIDEQGKSSRTYTDGSPGTSMVRIRPETITAPEAGWTALDDDGILWTRHVTRRTSMGTRTVRLRGTVLTDGEENRVIDWLRARRAHGNISLGNDGRGELSVVWSDGPSADEMRQGLVPPHDAVYL